MKYLYRLYQLVICLPILLVASVLTSLTTVLGCMLGNGHFWGYYPGKYWSWLWVRILLLPVKVEGREHLKKNQSYVFVANHQGAFDIFLIYGFLGVPIKWVMKAGIGKIPFVGAACRAAGFIFVDNSSPKAAARSVLEAERCLKNGASIVVFPEGSRTSTGKMIRFKKGAYQMAVDQHLPIIPITLNGPFDVLPIGSLNVHPHRMEMVIHPEVPTADMDTSHKGMQQFADKTREIIASALWEKYR